MSIKKQFLKTKPVCKVTFKVSADDAGNAKTIQVLGDFNGWDKSAAPMKALKSGGFTQTINLETGKEYQFRYLVDGENWMNDPEADAKVTNEFNSENDVVKV